MGRVTSRSLLVSVAMFCVTILTVPAAWAAPSLDALMGGDGAAHMTATQSQQAANKAASTPPEQRLAEYQRAPFCREAAGTWVMGLADGTCAPGADLARTSVQCEDGDTLVMPMWRRERATPTSPWGPWTQIDPGGCGVDLLPVLTEADFRRLPLPAPALNIQPGDGWVLVNIATIVYTDPTPVTLRTDLLGYGVTVEATPTSWTYDFGDTTTPLTTTDPGRPHPAFDLTHTYRTPGTAQITLATTWTGRYQIDGTTLWRDINGTATTTTTSDPITIEERTSRLVAELCTATPTPPDC